MDCQVILPQQNDPAAAGRVNRWQVIKSPDTEGQLVHLFDRPCFIREVAHKNQK